MSSFPLEGFVNREEALEQLQFYLQRNMAKRTDVLAVHSVSGGGKSKFLQAIGEMDLGGLLPLAITWNYFSSFSLKEEGQWTIGLACRLLYSYVFTFSRYLRVANSS